MNNAWKIGRIANIDIYVHWSFLLLPAWVAYSALSAGGGSAAAAAAVGFVLAAFGCVLLHELGHALAARHFKIHTHDITLLPIGGVARLARMPRRPLHELAVALAGPAVNVVIAASLALGFVLAGSDPLRAGGSIVGGSFLGNLFWLNIVLVVFNLLPAFPMDGGRVLRALMAIPLDYVTATRGAVAVGQVFAVGLGLLGLFSNWMLILVALFIVLAARAERELVETRASMNGAFVRDAMLTNVEVLHAESTVREILPLLTARSQRDWPVVRHGHIIGIVSDSAIRQALQSNRADVRLPEIMQQTSGVIDSDTALSEGFDRLHDSDLDSLAVVQSGRIVGLLTRDILRRWQATRPHLDRHPPPVAWDPARA